MYQEGTTYKKAIQVSRYSFSIRTVLEAKLHEILTENPLTGLFFVIVRRTLNRNCCIWQIILEPASEFKISIAKSKTIQLTVN